MENEKFPRVEIVARAMLTLGFFLGLVGMMIGGNSGTGIGLTIVKVVVVSREGYGSRFTVILPKG